MLSLRRRPLREPGGGEASAYRTLTLTRAAEGLLLAGACTASETTWQVVERECRAFVDSLGVEPAREGAPALTPPGS